MRFTVTSRTDLPDISLVYWSDEYSLETLNRYTSCYNCVVVNYVLLEVSDTGEICEVWGLCAHTAWIEADVPLPQYRRARLQVVHESDVVPGAGVRVNEIDDWWPVRYDPKTGWIAIAPDAIPTSGEAVEFLPGCLAQINQTGELLCLWLKPDIL